MKAPFLALSELIEREFGPLRVFRPNRDIRFAKDKSPYKTAAAAATEGEGGAAYYVQITSEGLYVGSGYYHLANDQLERFRVAVDDAKSGPKLAAAVAAIRKQGYNVDSRESLSARAAWLPATIIRGSSCSGTRACTSGREFGSPRWLHTKGALDRIVKTWRDAAPMNRWFDRHVGPSTLPPPEPD